MIGMPFEEPQRLRAADDMRQREGAARIERGDGERRRIGLAADRYVGGDHEPRMQQREIRGRRLDRACVFGDEGVARGAQPCPADAFVSQGWPPAPSIFVTPDSFRCPMCPGRQRSWRVGCRNASRSAEHTSELQSLMRLLYAVTRF